MTSHKTESVGLLMAVNRWRMLSSTGDSLNFRKNISPTYSESSGKPSKKSAEAGGKLNSSCCWFLAWFTLRS
jgi:hypothetical protein